MTKIDAHHHFWKYDPVEYGWIDDAMQVIRRDFLLADLQKGITAIGMDGPTVAPDEQARHFGRTAPEIYRL